MASASMSEKSACFSASSMQCSQITMTLYQDSPASLAAAVKISFVHGGTLTKAAGASACPIGLLPHPRRTGWL